MSAPAVAVPVAAVPAVPAVALPAQPAPVRLLSARGRRGGAAARSRPATTWDEPVTVTISITAADPDHRDRVLAALGDLIEAAGSRPDGSGPTAVSRPAAASRGAVSTPWPVGASSVRLDLGSRTVARDGRPIELSRREFDLLAFLADHPRRVFSRAQLLRQVWGEVRSGHRTVDVHVARLRRKVGGAVVTTVRGVGYRLADDAAVAVPPPDGSPA